MFNIQAVPQSGVSNGRDVRFIPLLSTSVGVEMWICHYTTYSRKTYIKWEWVSYSNRRVCATSLSAVVAVFMPRLCYAYATTGVWYRLVVFTQAAADIVCGNTTHAHTQMPWKPLKASLFSAAYLQYYLIHYSICIVDKMSNPKTNAGTLCRVISALCGSRFQLNGIHVWVSLKEASRVRRDAFILERFDPHCLDLF